jgi:hypothetical protein
MAGFSGLVDEAGQTIPVVRLGGREGRRESVSLVGQHQKLKPTNLRASSGSSGLSLSLLRAEMKCDRMIARNAPSIYLRRLEDPFSCRGQCGALEKAVRGARVHHARVDDEPGLIDLDFHIHVCRCYEGATERARVRRDPL